MDFSEPHLYNAPSLHTVKIRPAVKIYMAMIVVHNTLVDCVSSSTGADANGNQFVVPTVPMPAVRSTPPQYVGEEPECHATVPHGMQSHHQNATTYQCIECILLVALECKQQTGCTQHTHTHWRLRSHCSGPSKPATLDPAKWPHALTQVKASTPWVEARLGCDSRPCQEAASGHGSP